MQVRDYFNNLMTPDLRLKLRGAESGNEYRQTIRQMGKDGWLAVGWPKEHGGQGLSATEQLIFVEEANIAGAPLPFVTISTVGPALMESGSASQNARFLPGIASGDLIFAIGYSEPQAGSDLAVGCTNRPRLASAQRCIHSHFGHQRARLFTHTH